jgi:hypothetical protein
MTRRLALLGVALCVACGEPAASPHTANVAPSLVTTVGEVPLADRIRLAREAADTDPRFAPSADEAGYTIAQPGGVRASITHGGASVRLGEHLALIGVSAIGRGALAPTSDASPVAGPRTVSIARASGVTEWWRALPNGLEHGVDVAERASGGGELVVRVAIASELTPRSIDDTSVVLDRGDVPVARYTDLYVTDADARTLPARFVVHDGAIDIAVDDRDARYPITIDPMLVMALEANLASSNTGAAIDAAGTRVLLPGPPSGSVVAYLRTGTTWTLETSLSVGGTVTAVALSGDATIGLVAYTSSTGNGTVAVFGRSGTTWTTPTLVALNGAITALALATNGSRFYALGPNELYAWSGSAWTRDATFPTGTAQHVAISGDGLRVALTTNLSGAPRSGQIDVYAYAAGSWSSEFTDLGTTTNVSLGWSLALNGDGSQMAVGLGASPFVRFYTRAPAWAMDTLSGSGGNGTALAINADGSIAYAVGSGSVASFVRSGSGWLADVSFAATAGGVIATSASGSRVVVAGTPVAQIFAVTLPQGFSCGVTADCLSGNCVDGVCCNSACGGGVVDCQACDAAHTGGANGSCLALSTSAAAAVTCHTSAGVCDTTVTCSPTSTSCPPSLSSSATVCRTSAGPCDVLETCDGSNAACPADAFQPSGLGCRTANGACDQAEVCTGTSAACPADVPLPSGTVCRASTGACDPAETCSGTSDTCPADALASTSTMCHAASGPCEMDAFCTGSTVSCPNSFLPTTMQCRAQSGGGCDQAAFCTGSSAMCPPNPLSASGTNCGGNMSGSCSGPGQCTGTSAMCPGAAPLAAGSVCAMASATNPCDLGGTCDGTSTVCQMRFAPTSTVCHTSSGGACDTTVHCPGTSAACPNPFVSGLVCRQSAGGCDIAESCNGTSANCPADSVEGAGTVCRASTDPSCDPAEHCDGTVAACPADTNMCTTMTDAGAHDAGASTSTDASASTDASTDASDAARRDAASTSGDATSPGTDASTAPPPVAASCGCRAGVDQTRGAWVLAMLIVVVRRRRASRA